MLVGVQATGTFPVKLIFTDDTYSSELAGDRVVTVPDFVNAKVELSLSGNNNSFFVQVRNINLTLTYNKMNMQINFFNVKIDNYIR